MLIYGYVRSSLISECLKLSSVKTVSAEVFSNKWVFMTKYTQDVVQIKLQFHLLKTPFFHSHLAKLVFLVRNCIFVSFCYNHF